MDVSALRAGLQAVKAKIRARQLAKAPPEPGAAANRSGGGSATAPGAAGTAAGSAAGAAAGPASALAEEVSEVVALLKDADSDCAILLYNLAALHFEAKEYGAARTVLEHLFRDIEPIDESVAVNVCLLLLDVLVHCARGALLTAQDRDAFATQTEEVLGHMERLAVLSSRGPAPGAEAEKKAGEAAPFSAEQAADLEFRLHLYRAKALLMQSQLKASKKEIKSALEILQKSKFDLAAKPKAAGAGKGGASTPEPDWASSAPALRSMTALYLKANFEYLRQNYRKALKLLSSCHTTGAMMQQLEGPEGAAAAAGGAGGGAGPSGTGSQAVEMKGAVGAMYYNNVACVHHKMRRSNAARHYFQEGTSVFLFSVGGRGVGQVGPAAGYLFRRRRHPPWAAHPCFMP